MDNGVEIDVDEYCCNHGKGVVGGPKWANGTYVLATGRAVNLRFCVVVAVLAGEEENYVGARVLGQACGVGP